MPDKILYNRHGSEFYNLKELSEVLINKNLKWFHWYQSYGIKAVEQIKNNPISKFYRNFSDFFYLPTKYFNKELIDLFNLYSNVFLEIAIPTVINDINCYKDYQEFKSAILWGTDRNKILDINFLEDSVNNSLVVHPVKFNKYPQLKKHIEKLLS